VRERFDAFATRIAQLAGSLEVFVLSCGMILVWLLSGPFVGLNETWQLVINTTTTIITFLMVFLIQHTQNRDTKLLHLKLDELIDAIPEADPNRVVTRDETSDD
jgi:low affinity Fe/Cu permease